MKKVLLVLSMVASLYLTSFLFSELSMIDWYTFPTVMISILINFITIHITSIEFKK